MKFNIIAIAAVDTKWGIGHRNELLYRIPEDLRSFKEKTEGNIVVMGRKTLESLPGSSPLPKRYNVVLTRSVSEIDCAFVCNSVCDVFRLIKYNDKLHDKTIWVIGGGEVYRSLLPYCQQAHITRIHKNTNGVDTYFPKLDHVTGWSLEYTSPIVKSSTHGGVTYSGELWENETYEEVN